MGEPPPRSTIALVSRIRAGDRKAFNELFGRYLTRVESVVRSRLGAELRSRESVSDIVQEVYLEAVRSFDRFSPQAPQGFYRWLCKIVEHKIIDAHRRHFGAARRDARREVALEQVGSPAQGGPEGESPSRILLRDEASGRVHEALTRLPPDHRRVIELRQFAMLSSAEVGERMDRSAEAVRALLVRALKRLAAEMRKLDQDRTGPDAS
ncbi:MAG: sigma-70 family RNA polymerase sigma factor [Phycisphaerales bacterium]|nr:MAG: sigma-70 family RNA polymerase sigma factor [Phycisphaerales bacterium]